MYCLTDLVEDMLIYYGAISAFMFDLYSVHVFSNLDSGSECLTAVIITIISLPTPEIFMI